MSYPWGPENWPTFERVEPVADRLADAFWSEYHRLIETRENELERESRTRPITINLTVNGNMDARQVKKAAREAALAAVEETESLYLTESERIALMGMAFTRALNSVGDLDADQMERFYQDLFDLMGFKIVSKADTHEWPEGLGEQAG
ncbi:hypothetical protein [Bifidobacterium felsineum]|uniref:hypothetical protein n=1 Tax=Bifidobacterium felsineum TaxID=2045440 RepID=UPI001BDC1454|nr:hypothetical protein [Bifidobacterium felsineum]MBT1164629.1 hypothetical protein [Bifidobacterium felsineum]